MNERPCQNPCTIERAAVSTSAHNSESVDLLDDRKSFPTAYIVQDDQPIQISANLVIDLVDGLKLLPYAAGRVVEGHVDAVVTMSCKLPS